MPKKIIDIRPPKNKDKIVAKMKPRKRGSIFGFREHSAAERNTKNEKESRREVIEDSPIAKFNFKFVYIGIGFVVLLLFCWFTLSLANIEIWPEQREIIFEKEITVKAGIPESNFSQNIIAGKTLQIDKEVSQQIESTGVVSKKAKGIIRVYNAYSTYNQPLLATTRFVSASGKLFRTPKRVVIPGGHYKKGKLVPGFIDIQVVADQPSIEYNIKATTFSIPGFAGTSKYTLFYAKSFSEMEGGGKFPQVNDDDLARAKEMLSQDAKEKCWEQLRERAREENLILFDETVSEKITEAFSLASAGAEQKQFDYKVKASLTAMGLPEQDLKQYVKSFFDSEIFEGEKLYEDSLKINCSLSSMDFENNKMILNLDSEGIVYSDIDILFLKKAIVEKSSREVRIILESEEKIDKFEFELWPFWVKKVPDDLEKIEINLNLDPVK
jgi:hypothetical protein